MFSLSDMPSTSAVLSTYTTFAASAVLVRTVINEVQNVSNQIVPKGLQEKIMSKLGFLMGNLSSTMCIIIDETNGLSNNEVFEAAEVYLRTRINTSVKQLKVSKVPREKNLSVTINKGEEIIDNFDGMLLKWKFVCVETQKTTLDSDNNNFSNEIVERKSFELRFDKKFKDKVLDSYLPFVLERSKAIKEEKKVVRIHALGYYGEVDGAWGPWGSVNLQHPSTFDTLAMDPTLKQELIEDLNRFVRRRHFYKRVGKAWKRGYLLYGPPGTGKSSLVAAMANYLKFHVYDLELASLHSNAELRRLLVTTKNRSILVIEDIDCSINLENREDGGEYSPNPMIKKNQFTLSGLLNFIDGLWSSCGDERIIVLTTNHKDRLDPALLRPGRMDMHVHMSYCTFSGFKILASNYLGIKSHCRFNEIERLMVEVEVTPAEVAEELMKSEDVDAAMEKVVKFLCKKRSERVGKIEGGREKKVTGKKRKARSRDEQ
ncbi:AAA-ATPase [Sesamum alatum]|uniref:AAA-ATPase n=1 Tax=Sesamum alatum TaxID=300844 RepID=A0AAE1XKS2_9LAMI|nr:AAA-ATPase [Sesamum alatum]